MNDQVCATFAIQVCVDRGVDHFFVAPGSRCTPLTLAIARQPRAQVIQHYDERGLAFAAIGYAKATGNPGVFVCTSGTAVANAFPAVIEASTECIPFLLFTADRPDELQGTGANQTIRQKNIFGEYPKRFVDMPVPQDFAPGNEASQFKFLNEQLQQCLTSCDEGPVHLNWKFREPFTIDDQLEAPPALSSKTILTQPSTETSESIKLRGNTLIALGNSSPNQANLAKNLASRFNCPMLSDITSGLRTGSFELPSEFNLPSPDTILHLGGRIVSKSWLQWTREIRSSGTNFLHVSPSGQTINPNRLAQKRFHVRFEDLDQIVGGDRTANEFFDAWQGAARSRDKTIESQLSKADELTEPGVANFIYHNRPELHGLFVGNSMPIRDMDWFATGNQYQASWVEANRGASGIDGLIATAVGFAAGLKSMTTVVVGDLSALHDLNSFALVSNSKWPIVVVIINNHGGHIFDLLPIRESNHFEQFFATPHLFEFEQAAKMFGISYQRITEMKTFKTNYRSAVSGHQSTVLEVTTNRQSNITVRQQLLKEIRKCSQA